MADRIIITLIAFIGGYITKWYINKRTIELIKGELHKIKKLLKSQSS
jgi:uncharacterized protein YggU (UPF0235/DUF167 family)